MFFGPAKKLSRPIDFLFKGKERENSKTEVKYSFAIVQNKVVNTKN